MTKTRAPWSSKNPESTTIYQKNTTPHPMNNILATELFIMSAQNTMTITTMNQHEQHPPTTTFVFFNPLPRHFHPTTRATTSDLQHTTAYDHAPLLGPEFDTLDISTREGGMLHKFWTSTPPHRTPIICAYTPSDTPHISILTSPHPTPHHHTKQSHQITITPNTI